MVSDSITTPIPSVPKDLGKKKRANRSAKLKQCKLDARREQWLSQSAVNRKEGKGEQEGPHRFVAMPSPREKERKNYLLANANGSEIEHDFDLDSPTNSPTGSSVLGGTDSGANFTGSSSSSSSSGGCCSGSITEEEVDDDNDSCLDDWEAVADALAANDDANNKSDKEENHVDDDPCLEPEELTTEHDPVVELGSKSSSLGSNCTNVTQECLREETRRMAPRKTRAWTPDDAFRPQTLPNLSKQRSLPNNTDRRYGQGGIRRGQANDGGGNVPSSCPLCTEDLDLTDASFLPCSCGFQVCLFCYKKMLELDGRCPNCRMVYKYDPGEVEASVHGGNQLTIRLARSCSMIARA